MENSGIEYPKKNHAVKELTVFCNGCKRPFRGKCHSSGKPKCSSSDKHVYKAVISIPNTRNVKTKILNALHLDEAIQQTLFFKEETLNAKHESVERKRNLPEKIKPKLLLEYFDRYVSFLKNEGIPQHMVKHRSSAHIKDVERHFRYTVEALSIRKVEVQNLLVTEISDACVGFVYTYLVETRKFSNKSFNKYLTTMNSFYIFMEKIEYLEARNPFRKVQRKREVFNPTSITIEEFNKLIELVTLNNPDSHAELSTGEKKLMYKEWMTDAFKLFLYTGRRREEVVKMKFSGIVCNELGQPAYIKVPDYKVNRAKGLKEEDYKKVYVPIHEQLLNLLKDMGYEGHKNSEKYILANDSELSREHIKELVSKSFTHYWQQTGNKKQVSLRHLRKTYITLLKKHLKGNASLITGHSNEEVINRHYFDQSAITDLLKDFTMKS